MKKWEKNVISNGHYMNEFGRWTDIPTYNVGEHSKPTLMATFEFTEDLYYGRKYDNMKVSNGRHTRNNETPRN